MNKQVNELEEMRKQLNILKSKLSNQEIVSDKMIRQSMFNKMSFFKKYEYFSYIGIIISFLSFLFLTIMLKTSWYFFFFSMVVIIADVLLDKWVNSFSDEEFLSGNLLQTAQHIVWQLKFRKLTNIVVAVIIFVIWIPWLLLELYNADIFIIIKAQAERYKDPFLYGFIVGILGLIIGIVVAIKIYFKMQHTSKEIIEQINELKGEA